MLSRRLSRCLAIQFLVLWPASAHARSQPPPQTSPPAKAQPPDKGKAGKKPVPPAGAKPAAQGPSGIYLQGIVHLPAPATNLDEIKRLVGDPKPFTIQARGNQTLLIYSSTATLTSSQSQLLTRIKANIADLANLPALDDEISIIHAEALGDVVSRAKGLNYPGLTIQAAGPGKIRVTGSEAVTDPDYQNFLKDLQHLEWDLQPEAPVSPVFYVTAAQAVSALGLGAPAKSAGDKASPPTTPPSTTVTVKTTTTQTVNNPPCITPQTSPPAKGAEAADPSAGDAAGSTGKVAGCDSSTPPATNDKAAGSKPSGSSVSAGTLDPDLVIFHDDHPGDDAAVAESKRVLALVDFPRPEVIINTFSFQTTASNPQVLTETSRLVQSAVGNYNDAIQRALDRTWIDLQKRIGNTQTGYFDIGFIDYLRLRYVASPAAQLDDPTRKKYGLCPQGKYCLGYASLFNPLRPTLTDMLLAVISSSQPDTEIRSSLDVLEGQPTVEKIFNSTLPSRAKNSCKLTCSQKAESPPVSCDEKDAFVLRQLRRILEEHSGGNDDGLYHELVSNPSGPEILPLYCFREEVESGFPRDGATTLARPLRAAFADFLFNYKSSVQYPHEFSPHDLSQSAQILNSLLNPLIVAFNRDLAAALIPLEDVAACSVKNCAGKNGHWGWQSHDSRFVDNGVITVRTISGKETVVDTVTQSFFDSTNPPSITDLINSVGAAESKIPGPLKVNLTADEAATVIGALNAVQPAVSKVGRQFKIDITPRSLAGASSAELEISLLTGDTADPTRYSNGKSDADNISRVAKQTTTTKVRLESVKLFEISSFSGTLQRSRQNIPILPPFFELPYVGSLLSLPVTPASQYHRSTAIMSAVVVPTAADLATGLEFTRDRVCTGPGQADQACPSHVALSEHDLAAPVAHFNQRMVECFAASDGVFGRTGSSEKVCAQQTFSDVLPEQ